MDDESDIAAAEYVLGTLSAEERAHLAARLESDPALQAAVRRWQARLAPLDQTAAAVEPPASIWTAIERATGSAAAPSDTALPANVVRLQRRLAAWRGAAIAATALAAALAAIVVIDRNALPPAGTGGRYVAVVDSEGHEPALIAEVDITTGLIRVRSLAAETPSGKSLELWHIAEGQAPRSLGVLQAGSDAQTIRNVAAGPVDGIIAVTVEPEGGSPSGGPTGPVVYQGRLIPIED